MGSKGLGLLLGSVGNFYLVFPERLISLVLTVQWPSLVVIVRLFSLVDQTASTIG